MLDPVTLLDFLGGAVLAATGLFVLVNAQRSASTYLFFAFAGADAAATVLYRLSLTPIPPSTRVAAYAAYWWFQILALGALAAFGAVFPRRAFSPRATRALLALAALAVLVAWSGYLTDHAAFWSSRDRGGVPAFSVGPGGQLVSAAYGVVVTALLLRMAVLLRSSRLESHRDQAAFVLGGISLAYAPAPATLLVDRALDGRLWASLPHALSSASFLLVVLAVLLAGAVGATLPGRARRVVVGAVAAILLLTLGAVTRVASATTLQTLAIFVGPLLLAYAILRYAVFDIDARVRSGATVGITGGTLAAVFIVTEQIVGALLADRLLAGLASGLVAAAIAGLLSALLMWPVVRAARRLGRRVVPEPEADRLHARKLEIYRHAVESARVGGVTEAESRVLASLRETLGVTEAEHEAMLRA